MLPIVDLNIVCTLCSVFRFRLLEFLFKVFHRLFLGRFLLFLHVGEVEVFGGDRGGGNACCQWCGRARAICGLIFRNVRDQTRTNDESRMTYEIHRDVFLLLLLLETVGEHGLELVVLLLIVPVCIAALGGLVALHLLMDGGGPEVDCIAVGGRALDRGRCWSGGVCVWAERVFGERDGLFLALFQRGVKQRFL